MASGRRTARKSGVEMLMTMRELRELSRVSRNMEMVMGITMSTMSMSLENRLVMRPMGVESKKCMGECSRLENMPLWRALAAFTRPLANVREALRINRPGDHTKHTISG